MTSGQCSFIPSNNKDQTPKTQYIGLVKKKKNIEQKHNIETIEIPMEKTNTTDPTT